MGNKITTDKQSLTSAERMHYGHTGWDPKEETLKGIGREPMTMFMQKLVESVAMFVSTLMLIYQSLTTSRLDDNIYSSSHAIVQ